MEEMKHGIFEAREALDDTVLSLDALRDTLDTVYECIFKHAIDTPEALSGYVLVSSRMLDSIVDKQKEIVSALDLLRGGAA